MLVADVPPPEGSNIRFRWDAISIELELKFTCDHDLLQGGCARHGGRQQNAVSCQEVKPNSIFSGIDWNDWKNLSGGKSQRGLGRSLREEGAVSRWSSTSLSSSSPWLIITGWHSDKGASGNGGEIDASAEPFPNEAKKVIEWLLSSLEIYQIRPSAPLFYCYSSFHVIMLHKLWPITGPGFLY